MLLLLSLLAACGSRHATKPDADAGGETDSQFMDIATTPLSDLNLVRKKIPPVLLDARRHAYAPPRDPGCAGIGSEVHALDVVLGKDLDAPPDPDDPGAIEKSVEFVGNAAVGAVRGAAEGIIPFRSWIRKLTGAERHSKEVAAAIAAGIVRRAYLKGLGQWAGCEPPAAPRKKEEKKPDPAPAP